jgi:hypothetical protein
LDGSKLEEFVLGIYPWAPFRVVNEGVYFISAQREPQGFPIQFKSSATSRVETVAHIPSRPLWGLAISPDRRTILYSAVGEVKRDLRLVENFR